MEAKYIERLEQGIRVLENPPKGLKFNLKLWTACGTVACAVGMMAQDPWFQAQGLTLSHPKDGYPTFKQSQGWNATAHFFGLTGRTEAYHLFSYDSYKKDKSRRAVVRRIKKFLKKQE